MGRPAAPRQSDSLETLLTAIRCDGVEVDCAYIGPGAGMTYVFGKTSRQAALKRAADQTRTQILAIKLFRDDIEVTFRSQKALMKATAMRRGRRSIGV